MFDSNSSTSAHRDLTLKPTSQQVFSALSLVCGKKSGEDAL